MRLNGAHTQSNMTFSIRPCTARKIRCQNCKTKNKFGFCQNTNRLNARANCVLRQNNTFPNSCPHRECVSYISNVMHVFLCHKLCFRSILMVGCDCSRRASLYVCCVHAAAAENLSRNRESDREENEHGKFGRKLFSHIMESRMPDGTRLLRETRIRSAHATKPIFNSSLSHLQRH